MIRPAALFLCALSGPAAGAQLNFFDDPEPIAFAMIDGRPSFAKDGPYIGPMKGESCAKLARKDMKHDRVEPVCKRKPPSGGMWGDDAGETAVRYRGATPTATYLLSAGTWQAGHADAAWGYGDSYYAASDYQTEYVSYFTEAITINVDGCGCKPPHEPPHDPPPAVPLPASAWMLLAALGVIAAIRRGKP